MAAITIKHYKGATKAWLLSRKKELIKHLVPFEALKMN